MSTDKDGGKTLKAKVTPDEFFLKKGTGSKKIFGGASYAFYVSLRDNANNIFGHVNPLAFKCYLNRYISGSCSN